MKELKYDKVVVVETVPIRAPVESGEGIEIEYWDKWTPPILVVRGIR